MPRLFNDKHEAFARRYVVHFNAQRASRETGFAGDYGAQLLTRDDIATRVRELNEAMLQAVDITAARVMLEMARVAFSDIRAIYAEDGSLKPIHELDDDAAASIAGMDFEEELVPDGWEENLATGEREKKWKRVRTVKVKRFAKDASLGLLAKHFKLVGDEGDGVNALASALADRLKAARTRTKEKIE